MAPSWKEIDQAKTEKRCELVLTGPLVSERIKEDGLDPSIFDLTHLNFLEISHTCLSNLPQDVIHLENITRLVLSFNQLQSLPREVGKLRKLKFVDVSNNQLSDLPSELSELRDLQSLIVSSNKLQSLPDLKGLPNLIVLNFACNDVEELPSGLLEAKFDHLSEIIGNTNKLMLLPAKLSSLTSLKKLDVSHNQIKQVPGEIGDCPKLKELVLKDNPLADKRLKKLVDQCHFKQVLDYIKAHSPREKNVTDGKAAGGGGGKKNKKKKGGNVVNDVEEVQNMFQILQLNDDSPVVIATDAVQEIRPYVVCCILHDLQLQKDGIFKKFITLQNKLHDTVCEKRTEATIATHDLSKIKGRIVYDAREPGEIMIKPLGKNNEICAKELYIQLTEEADAIRKEKKRNTYPGIYKYLYLLKDKPVYPYLRDESGQVISFPPITNCQGTKISPETKGIFVEVTGNSLPMCKKVMDSLLIESLKLGLGDPEPNCNGAEGDTSNTVHKLTVEKVKVVDKQGQLKVVYPSKTDLICDGIRVEQS